MNKKQKPKMSNRLKKVATPTLSDGITPQGEAWKLYQQHGTLRAAARALDDVVTAGGLAQIISGKVRASPKMARALGLIEIVTYRRA